MRALVCVCASALYMLGFTSCEQDDPSALEVVKMPISICLPVSDVYDSQGAPELRAFGDPGTTEQFALPQYIYFFIVKYNGGGESDPSNWEVSDVQIKSVQEEPGESIEAKLSAWKAKWDTVLYTGPYDTIGDLVYQFNEELTMMLPSPRSNGRVYAVASAVPLTFSSSITIGTSSLTDLLNLTFSFKNEGDSDQKAAAALVKANLQNIYSTPYNYKYKGEYYGSFSKEVNVPRLNLLLYHVAAKVDLMWNVADSVRDRMKLAYLEAYNLYDGDSYLFRPTENVCSNEGDTLTSGYRDTLITSCSVGTQWMGRKYFYAIPCKNKAGKVPLQLQMLLKGEASPEGKKYKDFYNMYTLTPISEGSVFAPWIRGQISINNELDYNTTAVKK